MQWCCHFLWNTYSRVDGKASILLQKNVVFWFGYILQNCCVFLQNVCVLLSVSWTPGLAGWGSPGLRWVDNRSYCQFEASWNRPSAFGNEKGQKGKGFSMIFCFRFLGVSCFYVVVCVYFDLNLWWQGGCFVVSGWCCRCSFFLMRQRTSNCWSLVTWFQLLLDYSNIDWTAAEHNSVHPNCLKACLLPVWSWVLNIDIHVVWEDADSPCWHVT